MTIDPRPKQPDDSAQVEELEKTVAEALQQAVNHQAAGQTDAAEELYRAILEIQPEQPDANYNLGVLSVQAQQLTEALSHLRKAVGANPGCEHYWRSYIETLILAEEFEGAGQALELGRSHGLQDDVVEDLARRLKDCQHGSTNDTIPGRQNRAPSGKDIKKLALLHRKGRYTAIETFAKSLISRFPDHGLGFKTLGILLQKQEKFDEALPLMARAAELLTDDFAVHNDIGLILEKKGRVIEAESHFNKALEIKPDFTAAMSNLGNLLRTQGKLDESENKLRNALKLESSALLYNNLGATLIEMGRLVEAESCYRRALGINPKFIQARLNLGVTLRKQGQLKEAIKHQRRAVKFEPQNSEHHSNLLFTLNYSVNDGSFFLDEARKFGQMVKKKVKTPFSSWLCDSRPGKLRVGVVSGDLYNHPVGFFLESILGKIDTGRIELIAYPTNPKSDDLTDRIKKNFTAWKPLFGMNDEEAACLIQNEKVHILCDLSGHTSHNRLPMFAWKPAPVQASWLGYFATTGVEEIDYILVDEVGVPASQERNFTEKLCCLPDTRLCFSIPGADVPVADLPGLSQGYITFGCFQQLTKVGDEVLKVWSEIFSALPDARLRWQCSQFNDPDVVERLFQRLSDFGINSKRVDFHGSTVRAKYLAAHAEVDFILDTFPYPGGTTTCEALWMGVPTLTLAGDSLLSRQGASLLTAAGLSEWVVSCKEEYRDLAIAFANSMEKLVPLRKGLRSQVVKSPLFDADHFARNFEDALWEMWKESKPQAEKLVSIDQDKIEKETKVEEKPVMNFFNTVFWGTKDPVLFTDLMKKAAEQTTAYHFGDNMFLFQRNNSMLNDQPFMDSWDRNAITPPDRTIIWRRYILAMAGFHCQHLEGDFVECGAYQGVGAKTVIDYLGGKKFSKTFWLYDLFEHDKDMAHHAMQAHGPGLHGEVLNRFKDYPNVKIFKGFLPDVLEDGCPDKIAYLHLDLNQAPAEIATLDFLFDRVVTGGMIILDDYEMVFYRAQKLAEDTWFGKRGYKVFPLPTSQGFIIKR